jgi:DNA-binding CsgD family transcriptional regulator
LTPARAHDQPDGEAPVPRRDEAPARPLTDRQLEILTNVAHGRTNRQIGEKPVRNHLRTISHKLNSSDRTHSVVLAIGNGWIPIPIQPDTPTEVHDAQPQADGQLHEDDAESVVPSAMKASTAGAD